MTLHDAAERSVVESADFFTGETWLEQHFHATGNVLAPTVVKFPSGSS